MSEPTEARHTESPYIDPRLTTRPRTKAGCELLNMFASYSLTVGPAIEAIEAEALFELDALLAAAWRVIDYAKAHEPRNRQDFERLEAAAAAFLPTADDVRGILG